jgi:hypothetical protein
VDLAWKERRLRMFENRVLRRLFGLKCYDVAEGIESG